MTTVSTGFGGLRINRAAHLCVSWTMNMLVGNWKMCCETSGALNEYIVARYICHKLIHRTSIDSYNYQSRKYIFEKQ